MLKVKKCFLQFSSICLLLLIASINLIIVDAGSHDFYKQMIQVVFALVMAACMLFLKEKHFYKAAIYMYVFVNAILLIPMIEGSIGITEEKGYLSIFDGWQLYTASLIPLTYFLIAKIISEDDRVSRSSLNIMLLVMALPMLLVYLGNTLHYFVMSMFVYYVILIVIKKERRVNISWIYYLIPIILAMIWLFLLYKNGTYYQEKVDVILTRGKNNRFDSGWVRTILDGIFTNTPLYGKTRFTIDFPITKLLTNYGNYNIMVVLAKYGWLAFSVAILIYVLFFVVLFNMVKKINQSAFAQYTALLFAICLFVQAAYSLLGLFLLDEAPIDLPFISCCATTNDINYISFGIIFSLYIQRNKNQTDDNLQEEEMR